MKDSFVSEIINFSHKLGKFLANVISSIFPNIFERLYNNEDSAPNNVSRYTRTC